jgi:NAD(P)-dependent dehydrogenase (short-subunit alcohol dehydrogenase family)
MKCNVTAWADLSRIFLGIGHIDMVFANAGILDSEPFPQGDLLIDEDLMPLEPTYPVLEVNMKAVLNVIQLSWHIMKRQSEGGSIVLTASFSGYGPVIGLPLYSASKAAVSLLSHPFVTI